MAHVDSYSKSSVKKILKEHFRELENYKNAVDKNKSNKNLVFGNYTNADEFALAANRRVNEIMQGKDVQKQTNIVSEWVVSLPKEFEGNPEQFFKMVYGFCQARYGTDNVLGAFGHMDETNPHLHICLVPEATSRKTGRKTVSSASLLTRKELHDFHEDLENECFKTFGKHKLIKTGKTKADGLSLDQLKQVTANEEKLRSDYEAQIALYREYMSGLKIRNSEKTRLDLFEEWLEERNMPVKASQKPQEEPQREKDQEIPVEARKTPYKTFDYTKPVSSVVESDKRAEKRKNALELVNEELNHPVSEEHRLY